jgi:NAD(P)-dependent dehydrogenase (short-subunit alcohol dehydrogenase family)
LANAGVRAVNDQTRGGVDAPLGREQRDATVRPTIDVNLIGSWNTLMATVPHIVAGGRGGSIVVTSSVAGPMLAVATNDLAQDFYNASKAGIAALMRNAAEDLGPHRIRVNTIRPRIVATPMGDNPVTKAYLATNPDISFNAANALSVEYLEPADVSAGCLLLCSDAGRYVTGATVPLNAGNSANGG